LDEEKLPHAINPLETAPGKASRRGNTGTALLKAGVYVFFGISGMIFFGVMLSPLGFFPASALSVFLAAAIANAISMRIYEHGHLAGIGLGWNRASQRNLMLGLASGAGAASLVVALPVLIGMGRFVPDPESPAAGWTILFVTVALIIGAAGEEMLFRGYGFQILIRALGPYATIVPVAVLFGVAHGTNPNISRLAVANTIAWGVILGYAFWRSGDLWLAIGLHFGWNWMLPLFGVNLSGFTMRLTGYSVEWNIGALWTGGEYGPEGGLFTSAVAVALMFFLWKAPVQRQEPFLLRSREEA
jgi:uncharacterized protein